MADMPEIVRLQDPKTARPATELMFSMPAT